MSYDLQIWSVNPVRLPDYLPEKSGWNKSDGSYSPHSKDWTLIIGESDRVETEDIPDEIKHALSGIRFVTELNLSPIDAATTALATLERIASSIAKLSH